MSIRAREHIGAVHHAYSGSEAASMTEHSGSEMGSMTEQREASAATSIAHESAPQARPGVNCALAPNAAPSRLHFSAEPSGRLAENCGLEKLGSR